MGLALAVKGWATGRTTACKQQGNQVLSLSHAVFLKVKVKNKDKDKEALLTHLFELDNALFHQLAEFGWGGC